LSFSDNEFIAILEAAADFVDYRSGQYFIRRDSNSPSGGSALRLRDSSQLPPWAIDLRRMFSALAQFEFDANRNAPLVEVCRAGARFGRQELDSTLAPESRALLSKNAKECLERDLQSILEKATRPCLELERKSYDMARAAMGLQNAETDPRIGDSKFLGKKPSERLFAIFGRFPVLPRLWLQLISQWRDQVAELLTRLAADRTAISRGFLAGRPAGRILAIRCGLSDPHNEGRAVMLLRFASGKVIYKPRPGDGEWEWFSFLEGMNAQSFRPKLKAARVLRGQGYCWMECMESVSCTDEAAARRFYRRIGGMMGAAYLLRAVDFHRDNVIAAGENPVLVDAEALWHDYPGTKAQSKVELLQRTGFLPKLDTRSLQSRSSVLGRCKGKHVPRIRGKALRAVHYEHEIVAGFRQAWRSVLGTSESRAAFVRRIRRITSRKRRSIYRPTETYAAIARASIQPAAVRSGIERDLLLARLCSRRTAPASVIHAEIAALKRLDIPYFVRRSKGRLSPDKETIPIEVIESLQHALDSLK
jgi:lantibiotic modifying enzyme